MVPTLTPVRPVPAQDLEHILAHTEETWRELRGARLLVTGGTGFVGLWLLESLRAANHRLRSDLGATILTRDPEGFEGRHPHLAGDPAIRLLTGDVRSFDLPAGGFSHVIHGAASADAQLYDRHPIAMFDTIVQGTRRTLEMASRAGRVPLLLVSSGAVYGRQPPDLSNVPEDFSGGPDPLDPRQLYAEAKRSAELLGAIAGRNGEVELKVARLFAFVGPHLPLDRHFAIGNFIRDRLADAPIVLTGDGTPVRSYLYAAEMAMWLWTILARGVAGRAYNVGSARAYDLLQVARVVAASAEPPVAVNVAGQATPDRPAERYVPDTARARTELGLSEIIGLDEGVRRTLRWAGHP